MALTYYIRSWDPRSTYPQNPQEGDICYTITLDQTWAPVGGVKKDNIVKEEIYQNGAWVEQGGGGGGIENALVESDSVTWTEDSGLYEADFNLDPNIDPLAVPDSLGVIFGDNAYVLPAAGSTAPDNVKFGTWTEAGPSFATYPVAAMLDTNDTQYDLLLVFAADGSVTKITIFA